MGYSETLGGTPMLKALMNETTTLTLEVPSEIPNEEEDKCGQSEMRIAS